MGGEAPETRASEKKRKLLSEKAVLYLWISRNARGGRSGENRVAFNAPCWEPTNDFWCRAVFVATIVFIEF